MSICKGCGKEYTPRHERDHRCVECYAKAGKRSKRKGNSNELRFSKYLQEQFDKHGLKYRARRTPRSGAIHEFEPADIMFSGSTDSIFSRLHFENKNTVQWDIEGWYEKAIEQEKDTGRGRTPVIVARKPSSQEEFGIVNIKFLISLLIENDILKQELK